MANLFAPDALKGRRAFVTGGGAGIGRAISFELARSGADVIIADRNAQATRQTASEIGAEWVNLDVTDLAAISLIAAGVGPIDILVNNAGRDQHTFFVDTSESEWRDLFAVNLDAVLATTKAFLPHMQHRRYGRIVNIASEAGRIGSRGGAVYAAAKGGVIAFTKSIAREAARYAVTANVICPGPIETPLLDLAVASGGEKLLRAMEQATLLGRLGTPEEVAGLAVFLASERAGYITGEVIGVSGGMGI